VASCCIWRERAIGRLDTQCVTEVNGRVAGYMAMKHMGIACGHVIGNDDLQEGSSVSAGSCVSTAKRSHVSGT